MPVAMQVDAVAALNQAYEMSTSLVERMNVFVSLFGTKYPNWYWQVVVNYEHVYFIAVYNIRLNLEGDVVFMFSSNNGNNSTYVIDDI